MSSSIEATTRNTVKYEVICYLARKRGFDDVGYTIYDIAKHCPSASLEYLKTRLHIWYRQGLLTRRKTKVRGETRKLLHYKISFQGFEYWRYHMPRKEKSKAEASLYQQRQEISKAIKLETN